MARSRIYPPSVQPGKPRLGAAPEGWTTYRFADFFDVIEQPAKLLDDKEYQLITAKRSRGGVVARERLLGKDILTKTQFYVAKNDFVISNRQIIHGGCGIVPAALDGAVVSNEYTVLRPKPVLLLDYLRYLPHTTFFQQTCFQASVGVDVEKMVFDLDQWLDFKVHLPPVREQTIIAEILSSVDEAIAATQAVIDQTRTVKQGVLKHLLTKGIGHTRFKRTEIGEIPEAWEVVPLHTVASIQTGLAKGGKKLEDPVEFPYLRVANVQDGYIDLTELKTIAVERSRVSRYSLQAGDVLLTEGGDFDKLGRGCVWQGQVEPCLHQNHVFAVRPDRDVLLSDFLTALTASDYGREYFLSCAKRTTNLASINSTQVKEFPALIPPVEEQGAIIARISALQGAEDSSKKKLHSLYQLKSALMSDLLTGRKRVPMTGLAAAAE